MGNFEQDWLLRALTLVLHPLLACTCLSFSPSLCSQQFFLKDAKWCWPLFRLLGGTTTSLSPPIPWFSGHNSWRWTRYEAIRPRVGPRYKSRHMGRLRDRTHQRSWFRTPAFQINHRACWQQWVGSKISVSCNKTHQIAHIRTHQRSCS